MKNGEDPWASRSSHLIHVGKKTQYAMDKRLGGPQGRSERGDEESIPILSGN